MVAYMGDSTVAEDIPDSANWPGHSVDLEYAAGYVNGYWPDATAVAQKHPGKRIVTIDVNGTHPSADALDVENGDASPATAAEWIAQRIEHGFNREYPGVIYCNRGNITAVFNAMAAKGYQIGRDFKTWIATLDGKTTHVDDMTGVVAVQVWPATASSGPGHVDGSIVYDTSWKAPAPAPVPPPVKAKTITQVVVHYSDGSQTTL